MNKFLENLLSQVENGIHMKAILSPEEKIALTIYHYNLKNEPIYVSKLTFLFECEISRDTILKAIDSLFDRGIIKSKWENLGGEWHKCLYIAGEYKEYFRKLYEDRSHP